MLRGGSLAQQFGKLGIVKDLQTPAIGELDHRGRVELVAQVAFATLHKNGAFTETFRVHFPADVVNVDTCRGGGKTNRVRKTRTLQMAPLNDESFHFPIWKSQKKQSRVGKVEKTFSNVFPSVLDRGIAGNVGELAQGEALAIHRGIRETVNDDAVRTGQARAMECFPDTNCDTEWEKRQNLPWNMSNSQ